VIRFALSLAAATIVSCGAWSLAGNAFEALAATPPVICHVYAHPHERLRAIAHVYAHRRLALGPAAIAKS